MFPRLGHTHGLGFSRQANCGKSLKRSAILTDFWMREPPQKQGLYDPRHEHDSCGVGFVVHLKGQKSHSIVRQGLQILINLATNASAFWLISPFSIFSFGMHQVGDLARYPITVYAFAVRVALTVAVPFAFVSFFPASAVLNRGRYAWIGLLTPLVAAYCLAVALWLFRRGLRPWLVETANRMARTGLVLAGLSMCGVVFLAFDLAAGIGAGVAAFAVAIVGYVSLWLVVPLRAHPPTRAR